MTPLDAASVDALAPNADAAKNGRSLHTAGKLAGLSKSSDDTLLFGECKGSGSKPYQCSADFARPGQPTFRCSCPSRQLPCKHVLGLLYAAAAGKPFAVADPPAELQAKREKLIARTEAKAAAPDKPKQVNAAALAKKVKAQLAGIDTLEGLTHDLLKLGVGNMTPKQAAAVAQQANQLGDAYLPGARAALLAYCHLFADPAGKFDAATGQSDRVQTEALDQLARLHALVKQGRAYLKARLDDPNLAVPTDSAIAAWLGHAWTLTELKAAGRVEADAELVQLAFHSHDDAARQEFIDTGLWMTLGSGAIRVTQTLRPYKAAKHIKGEDSFFQVACVPELCVYPGGLNPRVRWDAMTPRRLTPADLATIRKHGKADFAAAAKEVKGTLKSPLADRFPVVALNYARLAKVGDTVVAIDAAGERLGLADAGLSEEPPSCHLLPFLPAAAHHNQTLIARFRHDPDAGTLRVKPLSVVTADKVIRLTL